MTTGPTHRIYLAGPEVFARNAIELGAAKKALCAHYDFEGVYPLDAELDVAKLSKRDAGLTIGAANERLIRSCEIVIANVTPFRGPSADVGTAYEMGVAAGLGLLVCAYTNQASSFSERTVEYLGDAAQRADHGSVRDADDMLVEDFELVDNLMLESCVAQTGGFLIVADVPREHRFSNISALEACLRTIRGAQAG